MKRLEFEERVDALVDEFIKGEDAEEVYESFVAQAGRSSYKVRYSIEVIREDADDMPEGLI